VLLAQNQTFWPPQIFELATPLHSSKTNLKRSRKQWAFACFENRGWSEHIYGLKRFKVRLNDNLRRRLMKTMVGLVKTRCFKQSA